MGDILAAIIAVGFTCHPECNLGRSTRIRGHGVQGL